VHGEEVTAGRHLAAPLALYQQAGARLGQLAIEYHVYSVTILEPAGVN
jgi:hypothetical protein